MSYVVVFVLALFLGGVHSAQLPFMHHVVWYASVYQLPSLSQCQRRMFVGCLTSQQHASVSQGRICADNFTCCHTEIEVTDQTFYLTQSQYTDTGPTSPSTDPIMPGAWQGSHWSANFLSHWYDSTRKKSPRKRDSNPGSSALEAVALTQSPCSTGLALTTRPARRCQRQSVSLWRMMFKWTKNVEKSSDHDQEFSGCRQKRV